MVQSLIFLQSSFHLYYFFTHVSMNVPQNIYFLSIYINPVLLRTLRSNRIFQESIFSIGSSKLLLNFAMLFSLFPFCFLLMFLFPQSSSVRFNLPFSPLFLALSLSICQCIVLSQFLPSVSIFVSSSLTLIFFYHVLRFSLSLVHLKDTHSM